MLRGSVRPTDHLCRKGGDEFLVWLPGADERKALEVGQDIQKAIAATTIRTESGDAIGFSVSVGTGQVGREDIGDDVEQVLEGLIARANKHEMDEKAQLDPPTARGAR